MKESTFKKWFIPTMKKEGWPFVRKYLPTGYNGTVDLICVIHGLVFGMELKQADNFDKLEDDKKGLRPLQKVERAELLYSGGVHFAVGLSKDKRVLIHAMWDYGTKERWDVFHSKNDFLKEFLNTAYMYRPGGRRG